MPDLQPTALAAPTSTDCRVIFGANRTHAATGARATLAVALPVLAGEAAEIILAEATSADEREGCTLFRTGAMLAGFTVAPAGMDVETAARHLYACAFAATRGLRLCRVWNYVPDINAIADGLETYRRFCRGRSLAFEQHFGRGFQRQLPAASAVGTGGGPLAMVFLATTATPCHFENPCQVPAFEYPPDYGPRPPSFSRASLITGDRGAKLFLSGTAAIRGHATVGPDDLDRQLPCTVENLQLIAETAGAGPEVGRLDGWRRSFKVYLRHRDDLHAAKAFLERHLLTAGDRVSYLEAGICRTDLRVEIEAVLTK